MRYDITQERGLNSEGIFKSTGTKYDRKGFDKEGLDREGFNREGYNYEGIFKSTGSTCLVNI